MGGGRLRKRKVLTPLLELEVLACGWLGVDNSCLDASPPDNLNTDIMDTTTSTMSNFFNNKARAAEATASNAASSSKTPANKEANRLQPWVEK